MTDPLNHTDDTITLLEAIVADRGLLASMEPDLRERLLIAAGKVSRPDKHARKALHKAQRRKDKVTRRDDEQALLNQTGIRKLRENPIFATPRRIEQYSALEGDAAARPEPTPAPESLGATRKERTCYCCRESFTTVHWFYDQMCVPCGDFNHAKRTPTHDLTGRVALVTGARVKIGYQAAIMLLRNGCSVIVTTRFPRDAARRYAAEEDFADWKDRLRIHGVDLRHTPSVEALCATLLETLPRLDLIINNACQTVRRPPGFYKHLMTLERDIAAEHAPLELALLADPSTPVHDGTDAAALALTADRLTAGPLPSAELSQVPLVAEDLEDGEHLFPTGALDADLQQVDLRDVNSWRLKLDEVETVELLEVHLVNAIAPYVINGRLKPLMARVPTDDAHIINVSAMEGQFYRTYKSDRHPHTNMAKAALNMMTRTSAKDYVEHGIHMNSVDTGWVTDEDPAALAEVKREMHRFHPPLDIVDGAARIVDPFFDGLATGNHVWGQFLKDYKVTDW